MSKIKANLYGCKEKTNPVLERLLTIARNHKERRILVLLSEQQGILTHEFSEKFDCKSNNYHNLSQDLNPRLIRLGWVISKYQAGQPSKSWRWYLEPVYIALQKPIRKDLRRTIHKHMEAANDE